MKELAFGGVVGTGVGRHATLFVPGRDAMPEVPDDWPRKLYPGSLNVRVDKYPAGFQEHGLANQVDALDRGRFSPAFEIPRGQLGNNSLRPRPRVPRGGDAQVWRARIVAEVGGQVVVCWALRRFGSRVGEQLEFVSDRRLRDDGLRDGQRVLAVLLGVWRTG